MKSILFYAALAVILSFVFAQAPDCNAFTKTCPLNKGTTKDRLQYDLTQSSALNDWTTSGGAVITGPDGAEFTIHQQGDAPTIVTDFYIFYGEVSVEMKASTGTGIVSSVYMLSDANDEIDWEALGGIHDKLQTDYFGKGDNNEDYDRWTWQPVTTPQEVFHKYTWIWNKDKLSWAIDGDVVRTVDYADAKGGSRYPQTPMRVRISLWAGGDSNRVKGTIDWAGGETDYSKAPFTMYVKSVDIVNYNPAESYSYNDKSGSADSIEIQGTVSSLQTSTSAISSTSASLINSTTLTSLPSTFHTEVSSFSARTTRSIDSQTSVATNDISTSLVSTTFSTPPISSTTEFTTNLSIPTGTYPRSTSFEPSNTSLRSSSISTISSTLSTKISTVTSAVSFSKSAQLPKPYPVNLVGITTTTVFICFAFQWWAYLFHPLDQM